MMHDPKMQFYKSDKSFIDDTYWDMQQIVEDHTVKEHNLLSETSADRKIIEKKKEQVRIKMNLNDMSEEILKKIKIILHDKNLYRYTGKSYKVIKNDEELLRLIRSDVSYDAFGSMSINRFGDLMGFLKADNRLIPRNYEEKLKESEYFIAFNNGVLDTRSMKLYPHSEKRLVFYELNANWKERGEPKRFLKFLNTASKGDESIEKRIIEVLGYLLSAVNSGKYFFVMGTASDSGKSTLAEMLQYIIGDEYIAHISTYQMNNRFALGDIQGKMLNLSMDLPKGKLTPVVVSIIKQITGGDMITTDQKYERMREVHSGMRFLFGSNYPISISHEEDDDSFWNRMIIVPFLYSVDRKDMEYNLLEKLLNEREDIISLCLTAFNHVLKKDCIFSKCDIADEMKGKWRNQKEEIAHTIQKFINECVQITGDTHDSVYAQDFYSAYKVYCQLNDWDCMNYNQAIQWCANNIEGCKKQRIHHTGVNPMAGFTGMLLKEVIIEGGSV